MASSKRWKRAPSAARPRLRLTSGVTEHQIQAAVVQWAAIAARVYPLLVTLYAIPNAARRTMREAEWMKAEGLRKGFPDMGLPVRTARYGALFIEHKSEDGTLTPEQRWWHERLREAGNRVEVSRSFEQTRALLVEHVEQALPTTL